MNRDKREVSGPQLRADRPGEQEAVRTTIVGGRPPGSGQKVGNVPRGIEVLVKKASVDPDFKRMLLKRRDGAAEEIGLSLEPAEVMMLRAASTEQLEAIIEKTTVPTEHRRAFLGKAAVAMLAAVGSDTIMSCYPAPTGVDPGRPPRRTQGSSTTEGTGTNTSSTATTEQREEKPEDTSDQSDDFPPVTLGIRPNDIEHSD